MPDRDAPVGHDTLMRMATFYMARHSASTQRVREVLARKIAARCRLRDADPPGEADLSALIDPVIDRLRQMGLLDDQRFARGKIASLAAKGRPAWRIKADLTQSYGVEVGEGDVSDTLEALDPLVQATLFARRRRLGPYRLRDRVARRDRDIASLARAGFGVDVARAVIDGAGDECNDCRERHATDSQDA